MAEGTDSLCGCPASQQTGPSPRLGPSGRRCRRGPLPVAETLRKPWAIACPVEHRGIPAAGLQEDSGDEMNKLPEQPTAFKGGPQTSAAVLRPRLWAALLGVTVCSEQSVGAGRQPIGSVGKNPPSEGSPRHAVCRAPFSSSSRAARGAQSRAMEGPWRGHGLSTRAGAVRQERGLGTGCRQGDAVLMTSRCHLAIPTHLLGEKGAFAWLAHRRKDAVTPTRRDPQSAQSSGRRRGSLSSQGANSLGRRVSEQNGVRTRGSGGDATAGGEAGGSGVSLAGLDWLAGRTSPRGTAALQPRCARLREGSVHGATHAGPSARVLSRGTPGLLHPGF